MQSFKFWFFIGLVLSLFLFSGAVLAHQPIIVNNNYTTITDPEISKAYYGELTGGAHIYTINSDQSFNLFVGILVPDIKGQEKNMSLEILRDGTLSSFLNAQNFNWQPYFEKFGQSNYWQGPEYKSNVQAGQYIIRVSSPENIGRYSLVVGETEFFDKKESFNTLMTTINLKRNFFNESPANFIFSPLGWGYILIIYIVAFLFGLIYRFILRKLVRKSNRKAHKNIGSIDRIIRLAIGIILLFWAITTSWSPILIFFSGFTFFEAIFSWCGFYAAIGKNTCPIN